MLPDTIWVGPFWTMAINRPGGSGWITALMTPRRSSAPARAPQRMRREARNGTLLHGFAR